LHRGDVQKHIGTAGVILDETEATVGIPHFRRAYRKGHFSKRAFHRQMQVAVRNTTLRDYKSLATNR
jgi:hypothetical protein